MPMLKSVLVEEMIPALKCMTPFEFVMSKLLRTSIVDFVVAAARLASKGTVKVSWLQVVFGTVNVATPAARNFVFVLTV